MVNSAFSVFAEMPEIFSPSPLLCICVPYKSATIHPLVELVLFVLTSKTITEFRYLIVTLLLSKVPDITLLFYFEIYAPFIYHVPVVKAGAQLNNNPSGRT